MFDPDEVTDEKLTVTPAGIPLTVRVTGALNPPVSASVTPIPVLDPRATVPDVGLSLKVKPGGTVIETSRVMDLVTLPPFAVIVIEWLPTAALALALRVRTLVPEPGAPRLAGEKLAVTPLGVPLALNATLELNAGSPAIVRVTVAEVPWVMLAEAVFSLRVKPGNGVTVTCSVVVWVTPPPFAVMVIDRVPNATVRPAVNFSVLVPEPGAPRVEGEKAAVIPPGKPLALNATAALKLFVPLTVTVTADVPPCATVAGPLALIVNPGGGATVTVTAKTLVRPPPVAVTESAKLPVAV